MKANVNIKANATFHSYSFPTQTATEIQLYVGKREHMQLLLFLITARIKGMCNLIVLYQGICRYV